MEEAQRRLYHMGAELATNPGRSTQFATITKEDVVGLERQLAELEAAAPMPQQFILPGATPTSAALDLARAIVRRAERRCLSLSQQGMLTNPQVGRYLNRLSLVLFVLARYEEHHSGVSAPLARD
jgi:cob(I)alamin adenosyltransferase